MSQHERMSIYHTVIENRCGVDKLQDLENQISALKKDIENIYSVINKENVEYGLSNMNIEQMVEMAKNTKYGMCWFSEKGPIQIMNDGSIKPVIYAKRQG